MATGALRSGASPAWYSSSATSSSRCPPVNRRLCIHGTASKRWFCRDPYNTFFSGTLASGFEPLRDARGIVIRTPIRSVTVNAGDGIQALGSGGEL